MAVTFFRICRGYNRKKFTSFYIILLLRLYRRKKSHYYSSIHHGSSRTAQYKTTLYKLSRWLRHFYLPALLSPTSLVFPQELVRHSLTATVLFQSENAPKVLQFYSFPLAEYLLRLSETFWRNCELCIVNCELYWCRRHPLLLTTDYSLLHRLRCPRPLALVPYILHLTPPVRIHLI